MQTARVVFVQTCQHCLPCPEGIEIGWVIWDLDQIPVRGIEQIKEWYAEFPVKASACVECGVCVERCPFDVEIIAKMREVAALFEEAEIARRSYNANARRNR